MERRSFIKSTIGCTLGLLITPYTILSSKGNHMVIDLVNIYGSYTSLLSNTSSKYITNNVSYLQQYQGYSNYNNYFYNLNGYYKQMVWYYDYYIMLYKQMGKMYSDPYSQSIITQQIYSLQQMRNYMSNYSNWLIQNYGLQYSSGEVSYGFRLDNFSTSYYYPTYGYDSALSKELNMSMPAFDIDSHTSEITHLTNISGPHMIGVSVLGNRMRNSGYSGNSIGNRVIPSKYDSLGERNNSVEGSTSFNTNSDSVIHSRDAITKIEYVAHNSQEGTIKIKSEKWSGLGNRDPIEGEIDIYYA